MPRTPQGSESDVCIHALPRCRWTQANAAWTLGALEYIGNILEIWKSNKTEQVRRC